MVLEGVNFVFVHGERVIDKSLQTNKFKIRLVQPCAGREGDIFKLCLFCA